MTAAGGCDSLLANGFAAQQSGQGVSLHHWCAEQMEGVEEGGNIPCLTRSMVTNTRSVCYVTRV